MATEKSIKTWVTLTVDGSGLPIAYHFQQEGEDVYVGHVQEKAELKNGDKEEKKDKEQRLAQYTGLLKKKSAKELVAALKKVKNKDDYFIFCDRNNLWVYAEELVKAGFTKGIFPSKEDFDMEKEREQAMNFVEENYPDVKIIPHQKVKTVEEAKKIVEASDVPLVVQSEGDYVFTVVGPDDVEQSKKIILATLDQHAKEYARGEIIIKEKLVQPVEITPQMVFWDGEPVYTSIDIETKNVGDGENNGPQVGCGTNLIIKTDMTDPINELAFPPKVYELAKKHKGLFIWDISLYFTERGIFFGEFCSNRFGYDSLMTEMTMAHGPSEYFRKIMKGENPIEHFTFGTAVRAFNVKVKEEQEIQVENWKPIWIYDVKEKDGKMVTVGEDWDLAVITGRGQTIEEAVDNAYDNLEGFSFKEKYTRTKADFLMDYPTSIVHRYNATNHEFFEAPDMQDTEEYVDGKINKLKENYDKKLEGYKTQLKEILYGTEQRTV